LNFSKPIGKMKNMNLKPFIYQAILDSLNSLIAIIDEKGNIIATNKTWQKKAIEKGLIGRVDCIGYNYLKLCENTQGEERETALKIAEGIKKVIKRELPFFRDIYSFLDEKGEVNYYIINVIPVKNVIPRIFIVSHEDITPFKPAEKGLKISQVKVQEKKEKSSQLNLDLKNLHYLISYFRTTIFPLLELLKKENLNHPALKILELIKEKLENITVLAKQNFSNPFLNLTAIEAQIAILVKEGLSSKEIAQILNLSKDSVDFYRKRIRKKLGLKGSKVSLKNYFQTLED